MNREVCRLFPDKVEYADLHSAGRALRRMDPRVAAGAIPYVCGDHFHLGRPPESQHKPKLGKRLRRFRMPR